MENSQWPLVLTNNYMSRDFTPLKGVIINVTVVKGACSHCRCLLSGRKETRLAPGEQVAFNTEILGWVGEGGFGPQGRITPLGRGCTKWVRGSGKPVPLLLLQPSSKCSRFPNPPGQAHLLRAEEGDCTELEWKGGYHDIAPEKDGEYVDGPG